MSLASGVLTDIAAVGGGERNPNPQVVVCTKTFEDGLKIGRFCKLDAGSADNFDGSVTPTPYGVVLRKVSNATEDAGVYDAAVTEQVEILRSGMVTVDVKTGETPAILGRVYISNAGDANDGLATATPSDVAVNGEFIREVKTGVWEISLNLPQGDVSTHIADATGAHAASAIAFTPVGTIAATDTQTAVAEVASEAATNLNNHVTDTTDAHDASAISVLDEGELLAAADVEDALAEIQGNLNDHEGETTAAHAGTAISFTPTGTIAATTVSAAIAEVSGDVTDHVGDTSDAHAGTAISFAAGDSGMVATDVNAAILEAFDSASAFNGLLITGQSISSTNESEIDAPGSCVEITSAGAETRTLADPTGTGQRIDIICKTYVGDIIVTAASAINQTGNNTLTFGAAGDYIALIGVPNGDGSWRWQVLANDGVALSTEP